MEKTKRGLYVEDTGERLQLIVQFDQGSTKGELIIPLTHGQVAKLAERLRIYLAGKQEAHASRLPIVTLHCIDGKHNA